MNLSYSAEELAFRDEVRGFIDANYPPRLREFADRDDMSKEDFLEWHRILGKKGWSAPAWPVEHGGPGWNATQRYIFGEESARAQTIPVLPFGVIISSLPQDDNRVGVININGNPAKVSLMNFLLRIFLY